MTSKGRVPPPHLRHPLNPGPASIHPDPYPPGPRPLGMGFPPFEMLPPNQMMAHKLSTQHVEMEKLVTENRRLAATLQQDLAIAKHKIQSVHAHIAEVRAEKERKARSMLEKMAAMEKELQAAEPLKNELQKARGEAQVLLAARQELISMVQQLERDLQAAHSEAQRISALEGELHSLRMERAAYDFEKNLYNLHLQSIQEMEKNYLSMSREVVVLRAVLTNSTNIEPRTGAPYSAPAGYNEGLHVGSYPSGQNAYGTVQQGQGVPAGVPGPGPVGNSPHVVTQPGPYGPVAGRDPPSGGPIYGVPFQTGYDPYWGPTGTNFDAQRGQNGPGYEAQNGPVHEARAQNVPAYDPQRSSGDDAHGSSRGAVRPQGQVPVNNNVAYGSTPGGKS